MFAQIGAVMDHITGKRRRTGAPVHRHSKPAGKCEASIWRPTKRDDVRQIVLAARRYEIAHKPPGKRCGPLGAVALEVLELLGNLVDYRTGRLEPSLDTMMRRLRRSRGAIVRALAALRSHGFVDWLRRFVPVENDGKGPQVKQTSNAYRLALPAKARACLGRYGDAPPPPPPEDHAQRQAERTAEVATYRASMPLDQLALFELGDNRLGQALARLARAPFRLQRESTEGTESRPDYLYKEKRAPLFGRLTPPCGGSEPR